MLFCVVNIDGFFVELNHAWETKLGWSIKELTSKPIIDFIHPSDRLKTKSASENLRKGQDLVHFENRYACKDGQFIKLSWQATIDAETSMIYATAILSQSPPLLESLLKNFPYSIISTDINGIITTFNNSAEILLGYSSNEVVEKVSLMSFHDPSEVQEAVKAISENIGRKIEPSIDLFARNEKINEWTYLKKDGTRLPIKLNVSSLFNESNEKIGYLFIAEDLSELKHMNQIIEDQRIQIVNSAKMSSLGEMASGIAHEINNPLSIIQANTSLLIERLNGEVPKESIINALVKINSTGERISKIVKGLRTISRDAKADSFEIVSIQKIIEEVLSLCEQKLQKGAINLTVNVPPEDILVECSGTQIFQILINLINNSYDAIIDMDTKWIKIACRLINDSQSVECSVTDSGAGIKKEISAKLMEPFFTTKEIGKGTGLGLSISRGIIVKHNGNFYLDEQNENTSFVFNIPLTQKIPE